MQTNQTLTAPIGTREITSIELGLNDKANIANRYITNTTTNKFSGDLTTSKTPNTHYTLDLIDIDENFDEGMEEATKQLYLQLRETYTNALQQSEQAETRMLSKLANIVKMLQPTLGDLAIIGTAKIIESGLISRATTQPMQMLNLLRDAICPIIVDSDTTNLKASPAINSDTGMPIWYQLSDESTEYYQYFDAYLRTVTSTTTRNMSALARELQVDSRKLQLISVIYHWKLRCKYFDQYQDQLKTLERKERINEMEETHRKTARKLFTEVAEQLLDRIEIANVKELTAAMELAVKMERVSNHILADKPHIDEYDTNSQREAASQPLNGTSGNNVVQVNIQQQPTIEQGKSTDGGQATNEILQILTKAGAFSTPADVVDIDPTVTSEEDNIATTDEDNIVKFPNVKGGEPHE